MTYRYRLTIDENWRRKNLLQVAADTRRNLTRDANGMTMFAILITGIYAILVGTVLEGDYMTGAYAKLTRLFVIAGFFVAVCLALVYLVQASDKKQTRDTVVNGLHDVANNKVPDDVNKFYETMGELYKTESKFVKEYFMLMVHSPETVDITYKTDGDTLDVKYNVSCTKFGNALTETHEYQWSKRTFFSILDTKNIQIERICEVEDAGTKPKGDTQP